MTMHERMESIADVYVAGGLGADERHEADQHAASCASCAALLADAKAFSDWARGVIAPDAPPSDLEDRLIARFRIAGQTKTKRSFPVLKRVLKVSASIAAALGLVVLGNAFTGDSASASLRTLASAESGFRATDRDEGLTYDFVSDDVRSLPWKHTQWGFKGGTEGKERSKNGERGLVPMGGVAGDEFRGYLGLQDGDKGTTVLFDGLTRAGAPASPPPPPAADPPKSIELSLTSLESEKVGAAKRLMPAKEATTAAFSLNEPTETAKVEAKPEAKSVQENRKIIRNADVALEVELYDATYTKLNEIVAAEKGFIAGANTQKMANGKIQATITLRIPPERFEAVIAKFKDLGTVRHQNIGSEDVTKAYIDLESRLKSKETLSERLRKLLAEGKGTVKELMEVEVQMGATLEAIEQIKGEIKYYDNQVGLSTITLQIFEKDLGRPFEYVQSLNSNIALTARDVDDIYAKAQKEIVDAGGQVVDSRMTRQSEGSSTGTIRGRVDADKFPALRDALKKLGTVTNDTVNQQKSARGGNEGTPKVDAPLRKELAVLDLVISSPPLFVTRQSQIVVETAEVESAYQNSRRAAEGAGGKIVTGSMSGGAERMQGVLWVQIDADKFAALVELLKTAGKVKSANVNHVLPAVSSDGAAPLLRERAEIELVIVSPPRLIGEEHGLVKSVRDTLANSWTGFLWSIEKLFVGVSLAGPWAALLGVAWIVWRRVRRSKSAQSAAAK